LRSLQDIERRQATHGTLFYRSTVALAASRASTFIMIYNCVEFATKEMVRQIRVDAADKAGSFDSLHDFWKLEILRARFGKKLSDGVNFERFIEDVRVSMPLQPRSLKNPENVKELPFSGNINHERLIEFAKKVGISNFRPPRSTLGGSDLELIRSARNQLAHGEESFEILGGQYSIKDIYEKLRRTREFMCAYIRTMDRYRIAEKYKIN
jgi:hypothetical protein